VRRHLPVLLAGLAPLLVVVALTWPLLPQLGHAHMVTAWGDSHVWVMDEVFRHLLRGEWSALVQPTAEAGYPVARDLRAVGGAALLLYAPLRLLLSPLAAGTLTHLLVFSGTGLFCYAVLGRLTSASPWLRAALATAWACSPTALSTLGMGEISNTQTWVLPAWLLAADGCCPLDADRPARPAWALGAAAVGLLGGLSSPYYTLALPLVAAGWAAAFAWRRRARLPRALVAPALLLGALFVGMLPVAAYYGGGAAGGTDSLVNPAPRVADAAYPGQALPSPPPVATPDSLLLGGGPETLSPFQPTHVSYLGLPLVVVALALGLRRRAGRGRVVGLSLLLGGGLLSLGPWLAFDGRYLGSTGQVLSTPVRLLELLGYPTRRGGLYFRYAVLAELGVVVMLAAGLSGLRRSRQVVLAAWLLAAAHVADSVRDTMPRWPLRVEPVADRDVLQAMAPPAGHGLAPDVMAADGAVLELPIQGPTDGHMGQASVLRALFHRRPTTGILRDVQPHEHVARHILDDARRHPAELAERLRAAGFHYVLLPRELAAFSKPSDDELRRLLGAPWHDGDLIVWDLGPAELRLVEGARTPARPTTSGR